MTTLASTPYHPSPADDDDLFDPSKVSFRQFLAEEIEIAALAVDQYERYGRTDIADWWRRRVRDLRAYRDERLVQARPAPGIA
jgi:hypothetical protein